MNNCEKCAELHAQLERIAEASGVFAGFTLAHADEVEKRGCIRLAEELRASVERFRALFLDAPASAQDERVLDPGESANPNPSGPTSDAAPSGATEQTRPRSPRASGLVGLGPEPK
jgi:hypothetical protein